MPDNWGFVAAAYGLTAGVLAIYWHRLVRRERQIRSATAVAGRSRQPSRTGHPRPDPASRRSLQ
jgi:hypothetical protein